MRRTQPDWNDTRLNNPEFDALLNDAKGELDEARRREMYSWMAYLVRDEGGLILPMFNNFISANTNDLQGWINDPTQDLMNGYAPHKCWFA
ncbi:hypothetical protein [Frigidibacter sp.]|uniref:hypothetical protein n=1 Tax=Frigidibacter sp. TaxID=2586418 RepID=UPI0027332095|nr:hypothetical protein [Frigidibacter sp.]MDP3340424.1 hypothetical protein [Frigidibacter sp.]